MYPLVAAEISFGSDGPHPVQDSPMDIASKQPAFRFVCFRAGLE